MTIQTGGGFEADVAPRPNGDGVVLSTDVTQLRRFATGLDTPGVGTNEGQRADSAPRATFGDGFITSGDVVQGRRYATGLDELTPAGGPLVAPPPAEAARSIFGDFYAYFFGREMRISAEKGSGNGRVTMAVEMVPYGDEVAAGFTLEYDASKLSNPQVKLGDAAPLGSVLTVNTNLAGRIGILVDSGEAFSSSTKAKRFVIVTFDVAPDAKGDTKISMTSSLAAKVMADAFGNALSARFVGGSVNLSDAVRRSKE